MPPVHAVRRPPPGTLAPAARLLALLALVAFTFALCAPQTLGGQATATAPDPQIEAQVRQLSAELRCPVCQGLSLADSPAELSREMQDVVRSQLAAGKSPQEVKDYFVGRYGEWILLEPKPHGWNLLVYALPVALVLGGLGGVLYLARRWTAASSAAPVAVGAEDGAVGEESQ